MNFLGFIPLAFWSRIYWSWLDHHLMVSFGEKAKTKRREFWIKIADKLLQLYLTLSQPLAKSLANQDKKFKKKLFENFVWICKWFSQNIRRPPGTPRRGSPGGHRIISAEITLLVHTVWKIFFVSSFRHCQLVKQWT